MKKKEPRQYSLFELVSTESKPGENKWGLCKQKNEYSFKKHTFLFRKNYQQQENKNSNNKNGRRRLERKDS